MKNTKSEILGIEANEMNKNLYQINCISGQKIMVRVQVLTETSTNKNEYEFSINDSAYCGYQTAYSYVRMLLIEQYTQTRYIFHSKQQIPDICGYQGKACCCPNDCDRAICYDCPKSESFHAKKDGLNPVYMISND